MDEKRAAMETLLMWPILLPREIIIAVGNCLERDTDRYTHAQRKVVEIAVRILSRAIKDRDQNALQLALTFSRRESLDFKIAAAVALWPLVSREEDRHIAVDAWVPLFKRDWWRPLVGSKDALNASYAQISILDALVRVADADTDIACDILNQWYDINPGPVAVALQCLSSNKEDESAVVQRQDMIFTLLQNLVQDGADGYNFGNESERICKSHGVCGNGYDVGNKEIFVAMSHMPYMWNQREMEVIAEHLDMFCSEVLWPVFPGVLIRAVKNGGEASDIAQKVVGQCLVHSRKSVRIGMLEAFPSSDAFLNECRDCPDVLDFFIHSSIQTLQDNDQDVKLSAIRVLGKFTKHGREDARTAVNSCLQHKEKPVRLAAKKALSLIS